MRLRVLSFSMVLCIAGPFTNVASAQLYEHKEIPFKFSEDEAVVSEKDGSWLKPLSNTGNNDWLNTPLSRRDLLVHNLDRILSDEVDGYLESPKKPSSIELGIHDLLTKNIFFVEPNNRVPDTIHLDGWARFNTNSGRVVFGLDIEVSGVNVIQKISMKELCDQTLNVLNHGGSLRHYNYLRNTYFGILDRDPRANDVAKWLSKALVFAAEIEITSNAPDYSIAKIWRMRCFDQGNGQIHYYKNSDQIE